MKSYKVETFIVPSGRFHWKLYEVIFISSEERAGLEKLKLLEQCCTQNDAAGPCDGFKLKKAAKAAGEHRKRELKVQK